MSSSAKKLRSAKSSAASDPGQMMKEVLDAIPQEAVVVDNKGIIIYVNQSWLGFAKRNGISEKLISRKAGVGTNYLEVLKKSKGPHSEEAKPAYEGIMKVMSGKSKSFYLEYPCHSKTEKRWFMMHVSPLGNKKGIVITHHNITERKLLEEAHQERARQKAKYAARLKKEVEARTQELQDALKQERELAEMKSRFISNTSHEFRTPLSAIALSAGFIRKFRNKSDDTVISEKLAFIEKQVQHLSSLLNDVLLMGKSESGQTKVNISAISLPGFLNQIVHELSENYGSTAISTFFHCGFEKVNTDPILLTNIVLSLLDNALKFSGDKKNIEFTVKCTKKELQLTVNDHGVGIPTGNQKKLFEPFYRGDNVVNIPGTGLGLAIAKKSAMLLGGSLAFKSKLNQGSTFRVTLPLAGTQA
jgi:signal transduction histidine kinase